MHSHDHESEDGHEDGPEPSSTGFLPMGLAVGLFVIGLFALGFVRCDPTGGSAADAVLNT